jgi:sporulation protein YlmC with PRC-barrel domain
MLVNFSACQERPIITKEGEKIGTLNEIIIDPLQGKILGFLIKPGFFRAPKILSPVDIRGWFNDGILVESEKVLLNPAEIVRAFSVIQSKIKILDQKVINPQRKKIGKVTDLTLDLNIGYLTRITVETTPLKGLIENERLIPWNKILKITRDYVMIEELEKGKKELAREII